jgi:hypothetical protein
MLCSTQGVGLQVGMIVRGHLQESKLVQLCRPFDVLSQVGLCFLDLMPSPTPASNKQPSESRVATFRYRKPAPG